MPKYDPRQVDRIKKDQTTNERYWEQIDELIVQQTREIDYWPRSAEELAAVMKELLKTDCTILTNLLVEYGFNREETERKFKAAFPHVYQDPLELHRKG